LNLGATSDRLIISDLSTARQPTRAFPPSTGNPIVTEIVDAGPFTPAEAYHQKYLEKNPSGYTCHYLRD